MRVGRRDPGEPSELLFMVALLVLIGFAAWTRWPFFREGLWRDEAIAVFVSQSSSIAEFVGRSRGADYNPPLFNVILALWGRMAGFTEAPLKVFAFGWGLLALAGIALATRSIFRSRLAGLFACTFAANNPIAIATSSELRPYSLSVLLAVVSIAEAVRSFRARDRGESRRWGALAVVLVLLAYSHIAGGLVVVALGLCGVVAILAGRSAGTGLVRAAAVSGAIFLWWLPTTWRQYRVGLPYETHLPLSTRVRLLSGQVDDLLPLWIPIVVSLVILGISRLRSRRGFDTAAEGFVFAVFLLLVSVGLVLIPLGLFSQTRRYLTIAAVLLAVLGGAVLARVWALSNGLPARVRIGAKVVIVFLVLTSVVVRTPYYRDMWHLMGEKLPKSGVRTICHDHRIPTGELVIVAPDYLASTVWYYCGGADRIKGFTTWESPILLDLSGYSKRWSSPDSRRATLAQLVSLLHERGGPSFSLIWDREWDGPPLFFLRKVTAFKRDLEEHYAVVLASLYDGRLERVGFTKFAVRE